MSRTSAVNQGALDIVIAPVTNPSFAIGRDIGRRDAERRVVNDSPPASSLSAIASPAEFLGVWQLPQARIVFTR